MLHISVRALKYCGALCICVAVAACAVYVTTSAAQSVEEGQSQPSTVANSKNDASPIYGVTIPPDTAIGK
jgi:hypothetical protein